MRVLVGAFAAAALLGGTAVSMAQSHYGPRNYEQVPRYREETEHGQRYYPEPYNAGRPDYPRNSRDAYYASRGRNAPYVEQRTQNGRSSTLRTVEDDPRGGTIEREVWQEGNRKVTRRTFTDPYGNKKVIVDRY